MAEEKKVGSLAVEDQGPTTTLFKRLDNLQWSPWHTRVALILGTGWALDAFETSIVGANINLISKDLGVTDTANQALITSMWTAGGTIGAFVFGYIADNYGRKVTFLSSLVLYSLFTVCTSFSQSLIFFLIFRTLTGAGVAAEYSAVTSSVAEFLPTSYRGKVSALILGAWTVGQLLASIVNVVVIPKFSLHMGWRIAFSIGAISAVFALVARRKMPESPRWLLTKGREEEAETVVSYIEQEAEQPNNKEGIKEGPYEKYSTNDIFTLTFSLLYNYPFRTLFACILDLAQAFGAYGLSSFTSISLLKLANFPQDQYPFMLFLGALSTIPGTLLTALLYEKVGRKVLLPINFALAGISVLVIYPCAVSQNITYFFLGNMFYQFSYTMAWNTSYPMYSEIFPTKYRTTGIGFAVAVGRIGGFCAPLLLNWIYYQTGNGENAIAALLLCAGFFFSVCIASIPWAIYGIEGRGKSLEDCIE
ncbi:hypothetical protein HDV06_005324 [Boothiomyces sp. JEL0866]|nr:hypothetical protein HDV06_005324 [Boothiomyces sp. JEL0866]